MNTHWKRAQLAQPQPNLIQAQDLDSRAPLDSGFWHAIDGTAGLILQHHAIGALEGRQFIVGLAQSLAYRGDGPLSTPLTFTSKDGGEPTWNEEVITLNAPYRQDAVELSGCFSWMMH